MIESEIKNHDPNLVLGISISNDEDSFVIQRGYEKGGLLTKLSLNYEGKVNIIQYLGHEITRISNFYRFLSTVNVLDYGYAKEGEYIPREILEMICPTFRVILEGYFRTLYIFSPLALSEDGIDLELIQERFTRMQQHFNCEYQKMHKSWREFSEEDQGLEIKDIEDEEGKNLGVKSILDKLEEDMGEEGVANNLYTLYRYCCAYSHGTWNQAFFLISELELVPYISILNYLEGISQAYLDHLWNFTDNEGRNILTLKDCSNQ